ncbi:MAG: methionine--tRNA ligase [Candidatus Lokiarchaeota archaeon]|nr:methionine--tRNA ligase [Candidatus Lokiarchaeota archaeon]
MTEERKWIVTSAWPYINAVPHLGNLIGSVLSADIFARYCRLKDDKVVFVSGSDEHGTPVAVSAMQKNITPEELIKKNHKYIKDLFEKWEISYDNYTETHNDIHFKFVQDFFKRIEENGYIFVKEEVVLYCKNCNLYLPDRFIEGKCPFCGGKARGDQCDECGRLLKPIQLIDYYCKSCGKKNIEETKSKHWYMDFPRLEEKLRDFIENGTFTPNAINICKNFIKDGIPARAVTRDLEWGIPAPFEGADNKVIYVWFEAVLGYISAVKEWALKIKDDETLFHYFWKDKDSKSVYFIGKDNIIFHLIIFPGLIFAYNEGLPENEKLNLPFDISTTEFLMYEGGKFSKSQKRGIWIDEAIEILPPDYWRYYLIRNRPELKDTSFQWSEFENSLGELNDIIGNFVHRILTFTKKNFNSTVPEPGAYDDLDENLISRINKSIQKIESLYEEIKLKSALEEIVSLAREGNKYFNIKEPWHLIDEDKEKVGTILYLCIQLIYILSILLCPVIPNSVKKIFSLLNRSEDIGKHNWNELNDFAIQPGNKINKSTPLFKKYKLKELMKKYKKIKEKDNS